MAFVNQLLVVVEREIEVGKMRNICQSSQVGNGGENFGILPKSCQKRGIVLKKMNQMHC